MFSQQDGVGRRRGTYLQGFHQLLRGNQQRIPYRRKGRGVGQIQLLEIFHAHLRLQRARNHIDAPRGAILADDGPADVVERLRTTTAVDFLLVDDAGSPTGVIRREDITGALVPVRSGRRGRQNSAVNGVRPPPRTAR